MALPILKHPTFELTVPSTQQKITYRPFLVKEEKILLLSQASDKMMDLIRSVKQIINNCIIEGDINLDVRPTFDIEYIFLKLRANSVSDIAKFKFQDQESGKEVKIEMDLKEVEIVRTDGHTSLIDIGNNVKLQMSYPTYDQLSKFGDGKDNNATVNATFDMIKVCIAQVLVGEDEVHEFKDYTSSEVDGFVESLSTKNFQDVQTFFDTMPKLEKVIEYKVGKRIEKRTFSGLADFFPSA
jgi:hypothetical protein